MQCSQKMTTGQCALNHNTNPLEKGHLSYQKSWKIFYYNYQVQEGLSQISPHLTNMKFCTRKIQCILEKTTQSKIQTEVFPHRKPMLFTRNQFLDAIARGLYLYIGHMHWTITPLFNWSGTAFSCNLYIKYATIHVMYYFEQNLTFKFKYFLHLFIVSEFNLPVHFFLSIW